MSLRYKIAEEIKQIGIVSLYFACCFGVMMVFKRLILAQYEIEFRGVTFAIIGALVVAKVVVILEKVSLGQWVRNRPVAVDVILRTLLYTSESGSCFCSKSPSNRGMNTGASALRSWLSFSTATSTTSGRQHRRLHCARGFHHLFRFEESFRRTRTEAIVPRHASEGTGGNLIPIESYLGRWSIATQKRSLEVPLSK
jgi:hypothetical protein